MRVGDLPDSLDGKLTISAEGSDLDGSTHEVLGAKDVSTYAIKHAHSHVADTNTSTLSTYKNSSMKLYNSESRS